VWGLSQHCEESFSGDGKWLATVVPNEELTVLIFDRKTKTVHRSFSSEWYQLRGAPIELMYKSSFLGGFLEDDSLMLWRYVPRAVANTTDASNADLHLQRWSIDGELLSDRDLGDAAWGPYGRQPFVDGGGLLWRPSTCGEVFCYRGIKVSAAGIEDAGILKWPKDNADEPVALPASGEFLSVLGRTNQKAVILDSSWGLKSQTSLPYFPSLLGPLVPNWFQDLRPALSHDGEVAAVGRTRVAWVLVDTDRDWGSEIVLLKTHPLAVTSKVKTGKGGITAIAVDHRNGILRLVGFWKERWHDLRCEEQHPDKCRE
ncbi:MAG: hypothetical protein WAK56_08960, partial [Candidatus Sulfotelmatobacter sp.]